MYFISHKIFESASKILIPKRRPREKVKRCCKIYFAKRVQIYNKTFFKNLIFTPYNLQGQLNYMASDKMDRINEMGEINE